MHCIFLRFMIVWTQRVPVQSFALDPLRSYFHEPQKNLFLIKWLLVSFSDIMRYLPVFVLCPRLQRTVWNWLYNIRRLHCISCGTFGRIRCILWYGDWKGRLACKLVLRIWHKTHWFATTELFGKSIRNILKNESLQKIQRIASSWDFGTFCPP